ncbi:MAG: SDR family NAD(P)-dependent oxidoreductase [Alphaproteobacteria bacterium]|nr:SDR family NAD(P)-dependent oxidoreductase [Alphaproteobacteria bacterium]
MNSFEGKHVWIVGASSGIGAALAKELAGRGAHVALSARRAETLREIAATLPGGGHLAAPMNVADRESVRMALKEVLRNFPRVDSVMFMAAVYSPGDIRTTRLPEIEQALRINLTGAFVLLEAILPEFDRQGGGQLALCASVAGYRGLPKGQPYCATKAALINLAESLKVELESANVDVRLICPGFVRTPLTDKNDFNMPMIVEPGEAARAIADGLLSRNFEIHFPKRFTILMKLLRLLPHALFFRIVRRLAP